MMINGKLTTDKEQILEGWADYYEELATPAINDDEYEISTTPKQGQTPFSPPPAAAQVPLQECRRGKNVINVKAGFLPKVFSNFHTGLDLIRPSLAVLHCKV